MSVEARAVPKVCPDCGHDFHRAGHCIPECVCQRNMAMLMPDTFNVEQRRIPVERSDHAVFVDIADSLVHIRAALEHINAKLGQASEDRTSVKIETGAKRELKPTVHVYAGDTDSAANDGLLQEAIRLHGMAQAYCDEGSTP